MVTVELRDIRLFGRHGVYELEKLTGNEYEVNLWVSYEEGETDFDSIAKTIAYEQLFDIVRQRMMIDTPLLEKVCYSIIRKIRYKFPFATEVKISIYKLQAAIPYLDGKVGVSMHKIFQKD